MMNIFDMMYEPIKLKGKIKIGTFFSGIGTPEMSLRKITNDYETLFISEINPYAIKSYREIHGNDAINLGDIKSIQEIPYVDILHHSPPCQDLSKSGKRKGAGNNTRSGLMYETFRIIKNSKEKPKIIIMEQVPDLIQETFVHHYKEVFKILEEMGYQTYSNILNAKNYEIPQNRDRLYMVSILGDYSYEFPKWIDLKSKIKDILEDSVDESYYLSEKMLLGMMNTKFNTYSLKSSLKDVNSILSTILARYEGAPQVIAIPEATIQGYALAHDGDGVYINRPHQKRGVVQDQMIQTLKTSSNDVGIVIKEPIIIDLKSSENFHRTPQIDILPTIMTDTRLNVIDEIIIFEEDSNKILNPIIKINNKSYIVGFDGKTLYRIRRLTPKEVWRGMGISDQDFYKAQAVNSNSQLYKQAGNAIVVNVYEAILRQIIEVE